MDKRKKWTEKDTETLSELWPHWGTNKLSELLNKTRSVVKCKVDKLHLILLPKEQRKCINCENGKQTKRQYGLYCKDCFNIKRKDNRITNQQKPREVWIKELLRTLKYRSKENSDLSSEYLISLWEKQNQKCLYSGLEMREPVFYGRGRAYNAASLDRIDSSRGYIKGNVVWCCWGCNTAKQDFSLEEFIENCGKIYNNKQNIIDFIQENKSSNFFIFNSSINTSP